MGVEIERKFLVADRAVLDGLIGTAYRQGYLSTTPERTVRVRRAGETAFLTVKGISIGASRAEFEYPIPVAEVEIPSLETAVEVPAWVGAEVTDDPRYFNANLVSHPFSAW